MGPLWRIFVYIVKHNPWYLVPLCILQAITYQIYKRMHRGVVSKQLFNGKKILLFSHSPNSSAFMYTAVPDRTEIMALRQLADKNTIFIDVGANVGDYSVMLMDKVKAIYAFEAHPATARLCKMNFLLNGLDEQYVIAKAVGADESIKYLSDLGEGSPINRCVDQHENSIQVPAITLDAFVDQLNTDENTNYILKVDVEGFEYEVFQGAQRFLKEFRVKAIVFEMFSEKNDEIVRMLKEMGYTIQKISQNNMLCFK